MQATEIQWTEKSWNPVRGCTRVSEGCTRCYAERQAARYSGPGLPFEGFAVNTPAGPRWTGKVELIPEKLGEPLRMRKPARIFVNSMSDLFHEGLSNEDVAAVFGVMVACPQHVFQVLTKRPARMLDWFGWVKERGDEIPFGERVGEGKFIAAQGADWVDAFDSHPWPLPNIWLGVSAEDQATADERIPLLLQCPASVRWVSAEPLLGPIDLSRWVMSAKARKSRIDAAYWKFTRQANAKPPSMADPEAYGPGLDWVVVGGESGPGARPMHPAWAEQIRDACVAAEVPFFFKQWGEWAPGDAVDAHGYAPIGYYEDNPEDGGKERRTWPDGLNHGQRCPGMDTMVYRVGKRDAGRLLDGRTWDEMPVREVA